MKVLLHVCMSRYYLATHFLNENDSEVHWSVYFQAKNVFRTERLGNNFKMISTWVCRTAIHVVITLFVLNSLLKYFLCTYVLKHILKST